MLSKIKRSSVGSGGGKDNKKKNEPAVKLPGAFFDSVRIVKAPALLKIPPNAQEPPPAPSTPVKEALLTPSAVVYEQHQPQTPLQQQQHVVKVIASKSPSLSSSRKQVQPTFKNRAEHLYSKCLSVPDWLHDLIYHCLRIVMALVIIFQLLHMGNCALSYVVCAVSASDYACLPDRSDIFAMGTAGSYYAYTSAVYEGSEFFNNIFSRIMVVGLFYLLYYHLVVFRQREERGKSYSGYGCGPYGWKDRVQLFPTMQRVPLTPVQPTPMNAGFY